MSIDDCLEEQIRLFLKFLKVKVQNNYFTCYSYAHPVLNSLPFNSLVQGLITNIVLLVKSIILCKILYNVLPVSH